MKCASKQFCIVRRVVWVIVILLCGAVGCISAQSASNATAFEVATIKPAVPFDPTKFGPRINLARATYTYQSLKYLIAYAYDVKLPQVSGPEWITSEYFDIVATLPKGAAKEDEKKMLQALLKERFGLAFHIEKREGEVYALVVGKHGAKLKPSPPDSPEPDPNAPLKSGESYAGEGDWKSKVVTNKDGSSTINMGKRGTQTIGFDMESGTQHFERSKMSMDELAGWMPACMGAGASEKYTFVDQTGIKGNYQVALDYPLGLSSDPQDDGSLARSLDALGLKLEKSKAPIDVYVVDHAEKPSAN
jgi:uncharacterized protein (TIGR03435 family)